MGKILNSYKFSSVDDQIKANLIDPFNKAIEEKEINFLNE